MNEEAKILVEQLRKMAVETGHLDAACLGCGYEHGCTLHGCQILKKAADQLERQTACLQESEAARTDLARRLSGTERRLHETNSELDRVTAALTENCVCDLCWNRESIDSCNIIGLCNDCRLDDCACNGCDTQHSHFCLLEELQFGKKGEPECV